MAYLAPIGSVRRLRQAIERQVEQLIALLDEIDGDPDLEDDELHDDELELGEDNNLAAPIVLYGLNQCEPPIGFGPPRLLRSMRTTRP